MTTAEKLALTDVDYVELCATVRGSSVAGRCSKCGTDDLEDLRSSQRYVCVPCEAPKSYDSGFDAVAYCDDDESQQR